MAHEIYSPNITMFGKVAHNDDGKDWQPSQRVFVGPIWATLNDQFEWIVENENGMKAMLSTEALIHNGLYYGTIDNDDLNLGTDMVFIYPDMKTVLVGQFKDGIMIRSRPAKIIAERCNDGIKEIKISKIKSDAPTFKYRRPTNMDIGDQPTIMDPYEKQIVYVNTTDWGDDGLFAKRDIKKGELVAYYNGLLFNQTENELWFDNQTGYDMYLVHKNLINFATDGDTFINLLPEYWTIDKYRATLTHKINHSFKKPNTEFGSAIHPRFGPIRTAFATKDIKRGAQILCDYAYDQGSAIPRWFGEVYEKEHDKPWPGQYYYDETDNVNMYQDLYVEVDKS